MAHRDVIVVGLSAGGLGPLRRLAADLPHDLGAALFVVQHIGARRSALAELLAAAGPLPAAWAADGEPIEACRIYVAPPDRHLLVDPGRVRLSRGPAENRTRPAADPLFRSAARAYGPRVAGVVLSGMLGDGTAGFAEIKRRGGATVVQDPDEAEFPGMPLSALLHTSVDHRLPVAAMADLLVRLAGRRAAGGAGRAEAVWRALEQDMTGGYDLKPPVALTCPTCGGAVADTTEDSLPYFTCHIGHRFAAADMDEAQFRQMEGALEAALRTLGERSALCRRMAEAAGGKGLDRAALRWEAARDEAHERAEELRRFVERGWQRPDLEEDDATG
jgi:two-component system, chemotaxis family, protein-glutamate methylesterase/glutaminase